MSGNWKIESETLAKRLAPPREMCQLRLILKHVGVASNITTKYVKLRTPGSATSLLSHNFNNRRLVEKEPRPILLLPHDCSDSSSSPQRNNLQNQHKAHNTLTVTKMMPLLLRVVVVSLLLLVLPGCRGRLSDDSIQQGQQQQQEEGEQDLRRRRTAAALPRTYYCQRLQDITCNCTLQDWSVGGIPHQDLATQPTYGTYTVRGFTGVFNKADTKDAYRCVNWDEPLSTLKTVWVNDNTKSKEFHTKIKRDFVIRKRVTKTGVVVQFTAIIDQDTQGKAQLFIESFAGPRKQAKEANLDKYEMNVWLWRADKTSQDVRNELVTDFNYTEMDTTRYGYHYFYKHNPAGLDGNNEKDVFWFRVVKSDYGNCGNSAKRNLIPQRRQTLMLLL